VKPKWNREREREREMKVKEVTVDRADNIQVNITLVNTL
jgi:hypothetical protein